MTRALIIGRFQPPHRGHLYAVRAAARKHDGILLGVGSAQHAHTPENPFTVGERFEMWLAALRDEGLVNVHLFPLPDLHHHAAWVDHVESLLPSFEVVITSNPLTRRLFTEAGHRVAAGPLWRPEVCSGTKIRERWATGDEATDLVPPGVVRVARQVRAFERLRGLLGPRESHVLAARS